MEERKALVVYYSRSGNTRAVAEAVAAELGADLEEIKDRRKRGGILGWLRSVMDAVWKDKAEIEPIGRSPADYDLVLIGTPVWAGTVSTPVGVWLAEVKDELPEVAFFLTTHTDGIEKTFEKMGELTDKGPAAVLALKSGQLKKEDWQAEVARFVGEVRGGATDEAPQGQDGPAD